jgi:thiamine kinase-like enzyme
MARAPKRLATNHPAVVLDRTRSNWGRVSATGSLRLQHLPDVGRAMTFAGDWLATRDAENLVRPRREVFCRGDSNLHNYLFATNRLWLVDFEDSGWNDVAFELADMAEHPSWRQLPKNSWSFIEDSADLVRRDRERVLAGRRLLAIYWLAVLINRDVTNRANWPQLADQAAHLLDLFEAD